ncbi:MAG: DUF4338 domain-containing protein [Candidatus Accumulibacter sp.]|uniref:DUF4338 domain-containing protein n=1 Tax=Candidatus Accumulibacter proximus TaxID=2954385 RepID=A0A935UGH6_9PROT|nr:DUF4338 domain-containing protein [Candidatus Accumulibacter proximus]
MLLETFVDPCHPAGTCYRAAGWQLLGATSERGLARPGQSYHSTPRQVWVKPRCADSRGRLCAVPGNTRPRANPVVVKASENRVRALDLGRLMGGPCDHFAQAPLTLMTPILLYAARNKNSTFTASNGKTMRPSSVRSSTPALSNAVTSR